MAPIFKRKTSFGGIPVEPSQSYVPPPLQPLTDAVIQTAKNIFGVKDNPSPTEKEKPLLCYRDILGVSRQDVADLFDKLVTGRVKIRILSDPSVLENQITKLKVRIKEVEELLATRSRMWQKSHRSDDMLSSAELERLKREEKKELNELQTQVRQLQGRLRNWGSHEDDHVEKETFCDMTFAEKHPDLILSETTPVFGWIPRSVEKKIRNAKGGFDVVELTEVSAGGFRDEVDTRYNIENYRKLLTLGDEAVALTTEGMTWENWNRWENAAICVAITEGLIKPDAEIIARYPGLGRWVVMPDDENNHEEERRQILKTGGGSLGGATIYGRGWRYGKRGGWTRRALESFDATARTRESTGECSGDAGPSLHNVHHDAESYQPD
jgi:hypothetical protein